MRCSYTELQVKLKSLWSNCCSCKGEESSEATLYPAALPLSSRLLDRVFSEGVLIHIPSLLDWKSFSFQPKPRISECCKYGPTRHFIVVVSPHLLWKLIMWYKILKFSLGHYNPTFQENAFTAIRNN